MGKRGNREELVTLLVLALVHRIGSIVNPNELYKEKYEKESEIFFRKARVVSVRENWNRYDKGVIKDRIVKKLDNELVRREYLNDKKFQIMNEEVSKVLAELDLSV